MSVDGNSTGPTEEKALFHLVGGLLVACFPIAVAADLSVRGGLVACEAPMLGGPEGSCRATLYLLACYLLAVPFFCAVLSRKLRVKAARHADLADRIFRTVFAWIFLPAIALSPFLLAMGTEFLVPRNALLSELMLGSFVGMYLAGVVASFAACLCAWVLINFFNPFSN